MDQAGPSTRNDGSDDEDDPVVKEIPIIHSKKLENMLYLLQFPYKTKNSSKTDNIRKCMFKPENGDLKLEMAIDTESPNFDMGRAEFVAHEVDGDVKNKKEVFFENGYVDKVFLESSNPVKEADKYAIAAYNGKEIHLTALKEMFRMTPHFPHLEKGLSKKRSQVLNNADSEEDEAPEQVTVKMKQNEPDRKNLSDNSYQELQAKKNQEPWTECEWHDKISPQSNVERLKLISDNLEDMGQAQNLTHLEYVRLLIPKDQEKQPLEPALPSHVLSLHALRGLPLQEQCKLLLKNAQIIRFQQIMLLLAGVEGVTPDALMKNLQKVAVLVKGNWVVKSEVLYPNNTFSSVSGVPAELMCRARDYILYLFTKQDYVERIKVSSLLKLPAEEVKEIFAGVSKLQTKSKGWELSLSIDHDFLAKHSELVQRQNLFWEHRYHQLSHFLSQPPRPRNKSKSASESDGGNRKRTSSVSCSDNDSGTETSKGKSPILARKKTRKDSCSSTSQINLTLNGAATDQVATS